MTKPFSSRFRTAFSSLSLGLVLSFPPLALRAGELANALPEDCLAFAEARSLPELAKSAEHPLVKKLLEGEMKPVLEALLRDSPDDTKADKIFEEETGKTPKEVRELFTGALAAGLVLPWEPLLLEGDFSGVGLVVAADFSGDEELVGKTLLGWVKAKDATAGPKDPDHKPGSDWPEDFEEVVSEVDGVSLHEWLPKDRDNKDAAKVTWALTGGRLVFCLGEADMREAVRRVMKKSDGGSLAAAASYKEMETAAGDAGIFGGFNLEKAVPSLTEAVRRKIEKEGPPKGVPINILQAMHGAGLEHLRGLFLSADLADDAVEFRGGLTYAEKPLLLKFYAVSGPGEPPLFAPGDASEVTWGTLDWGGMFDGIRELITETFPMGAGALDMGLLNVKNRTGVDLRKEILGQMGPNFWSMSVVKPVSEKADGKPGDQEKDDDAEEDDDGEEEFSSGPPGGMAPGTSFVLGVALRDSKAFALSLGTVFNTLAPGQALFEDRDYLGNTIHELKGTPQGLRIGWLIREDTLVVSVGETDLLEKALAGMDKKPAEPMLEREHVKKAFARLPGNEFSSSFSAGGVVLNMLIQGMKGGVEKTRSSGEFAKAIRKLPGEISFPIFSVYRMYLSEKSLEVRLRFELNP